MTRFIAISNRRGGVGKTTTTMMLAYGLSVLGFQRTLVIDLDAQSSTSITMMGHERWRLARRHARTVGDLLVEIHGESEEGGRGAGAGRTGAGRQGTGPDISPYIANHVGDVHITPGNRRPDLHAIPSSFDLDAREREMLILGAHAAPTIDGAFARLQERVARLLRSLDGAFDIVLMDCPPGLSNVAWGALRAADHVLVPYIPDPTAEDNVGWFIEQLRAIDPAKSVRVLANRVRSNNSFQMGIKGAIEDLYPGLGMHLPMRAAIAGALDFRTNTQSLRGKFGDGAEEVDNLLRAMLRWFESARDAPEPAYLDEVGADVSDAGACGREEAWEEVSLAELAAEEEALDASGRAALREED